MEEEPKKKLKIDLSTLELALDNHDSDIEFYLDTETGDILEITEDTRLELHDFLDETEVDDEDPAAVIQALKEEEEIELLELYQIDTDTSNRYLEITSDDPRAGYRAMQSFIETLENRALQNHLANAIRAKGAFRNFKNTLSRYPKELESWYAYKSALDRQSALRWLELNGLEPLS